MASSHATRSTFREQRPALSSFQSEATHGSARSVSARVKSCVFTNFVDFTNSPDFRSQLAMAVEDPTSSSARVLEARLRSMIRISGGSVPWSPTERGKAQGQLQAMVRHYGPRAWFLTLSPADMDSALMLRIATTEPGQPSREYSFAVISERLSLLANNPVAAALAYRQMLEAVFHDLLRLTASNRRRKAPSRLWSAERSGILGRTVAFAGVTEAQGRGSLHSHLLVWTDFQPDSKISWRILSPFKPSEITSAASNEVTSRPKAGRNVMPNGLTKKRSHCFSSFGTHDLQYPLQPITRSGTLNM